MLLRPAYLGSRSPSQLCARGAASTAGGSARLQFDSDVLAMQVISSALTHQKYVSGHRGERFCAAIHGYIILRYG